MEPSRRKLHALYVCGLVVALGCGGLDASDFTNDEEEPSGSGVARWGDNSENPGFDPGETATFVLECVDLPPGTRVTATSAVTAPVSLDCFSAADVLNGNVTISDSAEPGQYDLNFSPTGLENFVNGLRFRVIEPVVEVDTPKLFVIPGLHADVDEHEVRLVLPELTDRDFTYDVFETFVVPSAVQLVVPEGEKMGSIFAEPFQNGPLSIGVSGNGFFAEWQDLRLDDSGRSVEGNWDGDAFETMLSGEVQRVEQAEEESFFSSLRFDGEVEFGDVPLEFQADLQITGQRAGKFLDFILVDGDLAAFTIEPVSISDDTLAVLVELVAGSGETLESASIDLDRE